MNHLQKKANIHLFILISLVLGIGWISLACLAQGAEPAKTKPREMNVSVRNDQVLVGENPFMLTSYDEAGKAAHTGFLSLSADLRNTILDLSGVPVDFDPWTPMLGVQREKSGTAAATVSLRRKMCTRAFINSEGIIFPDGLRYVEQTGPSIAVRLKSTDGNYVSLEGLVFQVTTKKGKTLATRSAKHDTLIIENVPEASLNITITSSQSGETWKGVLFPKYRGAKAGLVLYNLKNVSVGTEKRGSQ